MKFKIITYNCLIKEYEAFLQPANEHLSIPCIYNVMQNGNVVILIDLQFI
jgi:hypothetical protein